MQIREFYGYTCEYTGDYNELVYLRSRYYAPDKGRFITRDSWTGNANNPTSFNKWQYAYSNPVNLTDPSGYFPEWCQSMPTKGLYESCVLTYYGLEPISYFELGNNVQGYKGCYSGPFAYRAPGYLEGLGFWALIHRGGYEVVYDFARMERMEFTYYGSGANDAIDLGVGAMLYFGEVKGFRSDQSINNVYRGLSSSLTIGPSADIGIGIGAGIGSFLSWSDRLLRGTYFYAGGSFAADLAEGIDVDATIWALYDPLRNSPTIYATNGVVNKGKLISDILTGDDSPWGVKYPSLVQPSENAIIASRMYGVVMALRYANAFEEIRNETYK